jgi:PiT family inorganic phosphate transporter
MTVYLIAAIAFAVACGVNDGGALVALSLRVPVLRPLTAVLVLSTFVAVVPLVLGTRVASTLTSHIVAFTGADGRVATVVAVVATLGIVSTLARLRVPTSLSLALIGAMIGSGLGFGFPVSWSTTGLVMAFGIVGPFVGAALALALIVAFAAAPAGPRVTRRLHVVGYGAECVAYGANDGQRMLAVFALAVVGASRVALPVWQLAIIAASFSIGAMVGLFRYSGTLGGDLAPMRPHDGAVAEMGGAGASFAGVVLGAPLSMTQAITGGLVGAATPRGWKRVRWARTSRVGIAWLATLPAALLAGAALGLAVHSVV